MSDSRKNNLIEDFTISSEDGGSKWLNFNFNDNSQPENDDISEKDDIPRHSKKIKTAENSEEKTKEGSEEKSKEISEEDVFDLTNFDEKDFAHFDPYSADTQSNANSQGTPSQETKENSESTQNADDLSAKRAELFRDLPYSEKYTVDDFAFLQKTTNHFSVTYTGKENFENVKAIVAKLTIALNDALKDLFETNGLLVNIRINSRKHIIQIENADNGVSEKDFLTIVRWLARGKELQSEQTNTKKNPEQLNQSIQNVKIRAFLESQRIIPVTNRSLINTTPTNTLPPHHLAPAITAGFGTVIRSYDNIMKNTQNQKISTNKRSTNKRKRNPNSGAGDGS